MDFIIISSTKSNSITLQWSKFYQRIPWNTHTPIPEKLVRINLPEHGAFIYRNCPPFSLEMDPCSSWLEWQTIGPPLIQTPIKLLRIKNGKNPSNIRNNTTICTHIMYDLYIMEFDNADDTNETPLTQNPNPCRLC